MASAENEFAVGARKLTLLQISIGGLVAAGFLMKSGAEAGKAAIYGAAISVLLGWLLTWGIERATRAIADNKKKSAALLYLGAAQRFLLTLALFAVGLAVLKLEPIPMVTGFVLTQAAYFVINRVIQGTARTV